MTKKRLKQDQRKRVDYNNRSTNLLPRKPDIIVAFLSRRRRPVCKRCACSVLTTQYTLHQGSPTFLKLRATSCVRI